MRYRKLDANGDYQAGHGGGDFYYNVPEAVGQAVMTRLLLFSGEWFLDTSEGTPWGGFPINPLVVAEGRILGVHTQLSRDVALQSRALQTPGVANVSNYSSEFDPNLRQWSVQLTVNTIYGRDFLALQMPTQQPIPAPTPTPIESDWDYGGSMWDGGSSPWDRIY